MKLRIDTSKGPLKAADLAALQALINSYAPTVRAVPVSPEHAAAIHREMQKLTPGTTINT